MAITTYEFYKNTYYGDSIEESSFEKWESKAETKLKYLLSGNLTEQAAEEFNEELQEAVCCVADFLFTLDRKKSNPNDVNINSVKSMSSGGQSVSFNASGDEIDAVMDDVSKQNAMLLSMVSEYLYDTGLLYKGV